jgi:hypothetical protein
MSEPTHPQLKQISRGVMQANARLGRLLELAERSQAASSDDANLPAGPLLDLLQAIDDSLCAGVVQLPAPRSSWWQRWLAPAEPQGRHPAWQGLELARDRAWQQLAALGIHPSPHRGRPDPLLHKVIQVLPCPEEGELGSIASVHRQGWCRDGDDGPEPVRVAEVSVYQESAS